MKLGPAWPCLAGVLALLACDRRPEVTAVGNELPLAPFASVYSLIDSIPLEEGDSAPIVRFSGLDIAPDGRLLLGDASEGNVKLFGADGRLRHIVGRRGGGPGEFGAPRFPRFLPDGRIFVGDDNGRVSIFDGDGVVMRTLRLAGVTHAYSLQPLRDGRIVASLLLQEGYALVAFDSIGVAVDTIFRRGLSVPTAIGDKLPGWRSLLGYYTTLSGDSVLVVATLSDSLWWFSLTSKDSGSRRLAFNSYVPPRPPTGPPQEGRDVFAWVNEFHRVASPQSGGGTIAVPFVQGILTFGDPNTTVVRLPQGSWRALADAPPILAASGDTLIALLHPESARRTLGKFLARAGG